MKVGVVGAGAVGSACVFGLVMRGMAREIVLVDRTRARARAVATDVRHGAVLSRRVDLRDGDDGDLAGAELVMITSGVNEKRGGATDRGDPQGRLRLLDTNAGIYRDLVPRIASAAPSAVILVVTDPPDPLADLARLLAHHDRVLSTGTVLDSLRFRVHLASALQLDPAAVEAQILGEHGTSEVFVWSGARIAGVPLAAALAARGMTLERCVEQVEQEVRYANISIIEGNEASRYGIAIASARIAEMVVRDERAVLPIGSFSSRFGVTLSLPSVLGRGGVTQVLDPQLAPAEEEALAKSAETLRKAVERIR